MSVVKGQQETRSFPILTVETARYGAGTGDRSGRSKSGKRGRRIEDMQVRNLSPHTQASYLQQVSLFARHFGKSPDALTPEHIRTYQIYLTNEKKLAAGSI